MIYVFTSSSTDHRGSAKEEGKKTRSKLWTGIIIVALSGVVVALVSQGLVTERGVEKLERPVFEEDTQSRIRKWRHGMERVLMSPLLGIPEPRAGERGYLGYYLAMRSPHNEFIQIWMWYGFLGLLAHVFILVFLLWRNIQYRMGVAWYLFYLAVIGQMIVDTAFKSYQFSAVFFVIAGYNWRVLQEKKTERTGNKDEDLVIYRGAKCDASSYAHQDGWSGVR
jgi:O-antigen ligase